MTQHTLDHYITQRARGKAKKPSSSPRQKETTMSLVTEASSPLSCSVRPQANAQGSPLSAKVEPLASAVANWVRRVNESAVRRFWEWVAVGFAFRGYTPL